MSRHKSPDVNCVNMIGSMAVRLGTGPCWPVLRRSCLIALLTSLEPHCSFRNKLKSASNKWMIHNQFRRGDPGSLQR
jgi:hypothetical protein